MHRHAPFNLFNRAISAVHIPSLLFLFLHLDYLYCASVPVSSRILVFLSANGSHVILEMYSSVSLLNQQHWFQWQAWEVSLCFPHSGSFIWHFTALSTLWKSVHESALFALCLEMELDWYLLSMLLHNLPTNCHDSTPTTSVLISALSLIPYSGNMVYAWNPSGFAPSNTICSFYAN